MPNLQAQCGPSSSKLLSVAIREMHDITSYHDLQDKFLHATLIAEWQCDGVTNMEHYLLMSSTDMWHAFAMYCCMLDRVHV